MELFLKEADLGRLIADLTYGVINGEHIKIKAVGSREDVAVYYVRLSRRQVKILLKMLPVEALEARYNSV